MKWNRLIFMFLAVVGVISPSVASAQLKESQKADLSVRVDFDRLKKDALLKKLDVESRVLAGIREPLARNLAESLKSATVHIQLPEDFPTLQKFIQSLGGPVRNDREFKKEAVPADGRFDRRSPIEMEVVELQDGPPKKVPFNFVLTLELNDEESAPNFYKMVGRNWKTDKVNGLEVLKSPQPIMENVSIRLSGKQTLTIGTDPFIGLGEASIQSKGLKETWSKVSKTNALRLACSLKSKKQFINQFCDNFLKMDRMAGSQAQFLKDVSSIKIAADATNTKVLDLTVTGDDTQAAEKLEKQLNGFTALGRMGLDGVAGSPQFSNETIKEVIGDITSQLKFQRNGDDVALSLDKPKNLDKGVAAFAEKAKAQAKRIEKQNRFKMAALAVHMHHDTFRKFPFRKEREGASHKNLSWRFKVMRFTDGMRLYDSADESKPWDDPVNKKLVNKMPADYGDSKTHSDICWIESEVTRFREIVDGTSNTIMTMENPAGVPWLEPKDLTPDQAVKLVSNLKDGETLVVGFYDGSVRRISNKVSEKDLRAMMTPNGGEIVDMRKIFPRR